MAAGRMCRARSPTAAVLLLLGSTGIVASAVTNSTEGSLVVWPPLAGTCNSATFASFPVGAQAQSSAPAPSPASELSWSLGPETSSAAWAPLRSVLESASSGKRQTLLLSPSELQAVYSAVKASPDRFRHGDGVMLDVRLTAKDVQGSLTAASARLELRDGEPPPSIEHVGPGTAVRVREDERITLEVRTGEVAPSCSGSPRRVGITWEYTRPDMQSWVPLSSAQPQLADEAREPHKVSFAPLAFRPHTRHMFRASAFYEGSSTVRWPLPSVVFRVAVVDRAPPQARVTGPSHPYLQCDFTLDASASSDPWGHPGSSLAYRWSCRPLDPRMDALRDACSRLGNFASEMVWRGDGDGASGPTLRVAGAQLPVGAYLFSVEVRRRYGAAHTGPRPDSSDTAQIVVTVVGGARPPVAVVAPWAEAGRVSVEVGGPFTVRALVEGSAPYGCLVGAGWVWRWALQERTGGQVRFPGLLASSTNHSPIGPPTEVTTSEFPVALLTPGQVYSYSLLWAPRWVELERLQQREVGGVFLPGDVTAVKMLVAATSAPFVADGPPSGGAVSASPAGGEAAKTLFTLETSIWSDELPGQLQFAFYRLPGAAARNANGGVQVEWEDALSPRYWARLGGRLIRPWSLESTLSGILLPPGDHLLAVRARDALGAVGTTFASGPTLNGASAFSVLEAESALNAAAASSSFDRLLAAIDAVSEALSAAGNSPSIAAEKEASAAALFNALEASAPLAAAGAGGADALRLPQALAAVVRGGGVGVGPAAMARASAILDSCLDLLASRGAAGMPQGAGDALLGALAVVNVGLGDPGAAQATSAVEGGLTAADMMMALGQRLGGLALQGLGGGELQTLRGEGAAGSPGASLSLRLVHPGGVGSNTSGADIRALGLHLPLDALPLPAAGGVGARRRLAEAPGNSSCGSVGVQRLDWLGGNPYRFASPTAGHNGLVAASAAVTTLHFWRCGEAVALQATTGSPLRVEMQLPAGAPPGSRSPDCLLFDVAAQAWVADGLRVEQDPSSNASLVTCVVSRAATAAAGASLVLLPEGIPPVPTQAPPPPPPESDLTLLFIGVGSGAALFLLAVCIGACCWRRSRRKLSKVSDAKLSRPDGEWKLEDVGKDTPDSKAGTPSRVVASTELRALEDSPATPTKLRAAASPPSASPGDAPDLPLILSMLNSHPRARANRAREQQSSGASVERMMALADNYMTPPRERRLH